MFIVLHLYDVPHILTLSFDTSMSFDKYDLQQLKQSIFQLIII